MYWECRCHANGACNCDQSGVGTGLQGFWSDLWDMGVDAVSNEAHNRFSTAGESAHIAAQNEAVAEFEAAALTPYRSGRISAEQARQIIRSIASAFASFANRLGYPRALAGAREVEALAERLIMDLGAYTTVPAPSGYLPPMLQSAGISAPMILGIAGLFFLMRGRR